MADCRIVLLNYNGRDLLKECLPSILEAKARSRNRCLVTVLDNQSVDESEEVVRKDFPDVEFVKSGANRVFCSYNPLIEASAEPFVILLNNDIRVDKGFVDPLLSALKADPRAFFASPKTLNYQSGEYEGGLAKLEMRWGLLWGSSKFKGFEKKIAQPGLTMQCGFGAFRRDLFVQLKGYDDLYLPGTVEDADLCFRAYRQGLKGHYCPDSIVYHMGQVSFKRAFGISGIRRLNRRNLYLFIWKNVRSPYVLLQHFLMLPFQLLKYICFGQVDFILGFKDALALWPKAAARRKQALDEPSLVSDASIFKLSKAL